MPYVYIVECSDLTYYVGSTWNLELRIYQHNSDRDGAAYTRVRRPVRLVWSAWFDSIAEAFAFEKRVQGWRREKRVALIEGRFDDLPGLASRRRHARDGGFETVAALRDGPGGPPQGPPPRPPSIPERPPQPPADGG
jgi:putative endonuclease